MKQEEVVAKRVAREILSIIEEICFSDEYREFRIDYGTNGQRDLILATIKKKYGIS